MVGGREHGVGVRNDYVPSKLEWNYCRHSSGKAAHALNSDSCLFFLSFFVLCVCIWPKLNPFEAGTMMEVKRM